MTRDDILARVKRGDLGVDDASSLLEKLERLNLEKLNASRPPQIVEVAVRTPPRFKVAEKSGWCSIYFGGMWRPCTLPSNLWMELLEPENVKRLKQFIEENKNKFRNKE